MFTGLVQTTAEVASLEGGRLELRTDSPLELSEGDSVAVNGACLTATAIGGTSFSADVMEETLRRTAWATSRRGTP